MNPEIIIRNEGIGDIFAIIALTVEAFRTREAGVHIEVIPVA